LETAARRGRQGHRGRTRKRIFDFGGLAHDRRGQLHADRRCRRLHRLKDSDIGDVSRRQGELRQSIVPPFCPAILNRDVLTFKVAGLA
jgi:hypothetical protein